MSMFYCFSCRTTLGYLRDLPTGPLLVTDYQKRKHEKHAVVSTSEHLQSIFFDPSTSAIRPYVEDALLRGPMEVDDQNPINFYSTSTGTVGFRYECGTPIKSQDAVRVVLSTSPERRHAFPENTARLVSATCTKCGRRIFG
jgi:hypothetical protein